MEKNTVGTALYYCSQEAKIDTPKTLHDRSLSWNGTATSSTSGVCKLV